MMIAIASEPGTEMYDVGSVDRIPMGEGRRYRVANQEIAVFRLRTGEVYAVQANCPHKGGPLEDGLTGLGRVVCPLHARAFDLVTGDAVRHSCEALKSYAVEVTAGGTIRIQVPGLETGS